MDDAVCVAMAETDSPIDIPRPSTRTHHPPWSWIYTVTSALTLFCSPVCSFGALLCAIHAYTDHRVGDMEAANNKLRTARACIIMSMIVGATTWILLILAYFGVLSKLQKND